MGLYDKFARLANDREQFQTSGLNPFGTCIDEVYSATQGRIGDQKIVLAGTNNYLGLTFDAQAIAAGQSALAALGTGTTGSRMANGSYGSHLTLERELAEFFDRPSAIVFSTGYTANLGVISTLAGPGSVVLIDADSHASIYDACALGGAEIIRFRHNDAADLERRMVRLGERAREAIVIVEGIYSMLGDVAPLVEIVDIKRRLGGYLLVDEAHSFGVMGEHGRGLAEALGVEQDVDIILGTFSKSLASIGGFAVGGKGMDVLRYSSRPYIFTASPSPSSIASVRTALQKIARHPELRGKTVEQRAPPVPRPRRTGVYPGAAHQPGSAGDDRFEGRRAAFLARADRPRRVCESGAATGRAGGRYPAALQRQCGTQR